MELKEVYALAQGDYENAMMRLLTEERIKKYLSKFTADAWLERIEEALDAKDYEGAFREVHNLKGLCASLSLNKLGASSIELTEALRGGNPTVDLEPLVADVRADYEMTVEALRQLDE